MIAENKTTESRENELLCFFDQRIAGEHKKKNRKYLYRDLIITAAVVFLLFNIIAGAAIVQGDSMNPGLTNGSVVLFCRLGNTYKKDDIVIFRPTSGKQLLVKRVVATAGDKVDIDNKTGTLLVNGISQKELTDGKTYARNDGIQFPLTVASNCVFVLGDNRKIALDSRSFGAIKTNRLLGKVFFEIRILGGST